MANKFPVTVSVANGKASLQELQPTDKINLGNIANVIIEGNDGEVIVIGSGVDAPLTSIAVQDLVDSGNITIDTGVLAGQTLDEAFANTLTLGGGTMTGPITLPGAPTESLHAVTKAYADGIANDKVSKGGDTMSGILTLSAGPSSDLHAATKRYVDDASANLVAKAGSTMTGTLLLDAHPTAGSAALTAATKQYVDNHTPAYTAGEITVTPTGDIASTDVQSALDELDSEKLAIAGGTMSGTLTLDELSQTDPDDAATRAYADLKLPISGGTMLGDLTLIGTPTQPHHAVTKDYVDGIAAGINYHPDVVAATTADLATLTGGTATYAELDPPAPTPGEGATITLSVTLTELDGVTLSDGNRILVKNQATKTENGIYTIGGAGLILTRAVEEDQPDEFIGGDFFFVDYGDTLGGTAWVQRIDVQTIGVDDIEFVQIGRPLQYNAGTGLNLNTFTFNIANTTVTSGAYGGSDSVGTFTVNHQGQLTLASNAAIKSNAANLTGTVLSTSVVSSSLTSVGQLGSLGVTGAVTAGSFSGDGGNLSNIAGGNVTGTVANATHAASAAAANTANTVTDAAQANITSVGTLTGLDVSGKTTTVDLQVSGNAILGPQPGGAFWDDDVPLSLTRTRAGGLQTQLNLINEGGSAGAGSAIDFYTYTGGGNNPEARISGVDDGNFSSNLSMWTKEQGNVGNMPMQEVARFDSNRNTTLFGNLNVNGASNLGPVGNVTITGGTSGQLLSTNGSGSLSWTSPADASRIANGTSNVSVANNGNVSVGVGGTANVVSVSSGAMTISGNTIITGNLTVSGTRTVVNSNVAYVVDPMIELGGGPNSAALTTNDGKDRGALLHRYTTAPVDSFMGWDNSNSEFAFGSNVTELNDVITFNAFGNLRAGDGKFANIELGTAPTLNSHAATKLYVDNINANLVAKTGSTMTGYLTLNGDPESSLHAATKQYVDAVRTDLGDYLPLAGGTLTGVLTLEADPESNLDAATKQYVDTNTNNKLPLAGGNVTGNLVVGNGATSTSSTSGALKVTGGLGVSGNVYVGGVSGLGAVGNVKITGGSSGQMITTDGAGNLSFATPASASIKYTKEWHVSLQGNDTTGDGSYDSPYATFTKALAMATDTGQVIYAHAGIYTENVTVSDLNCDIIGVNDSAVVQLQGNWTFASNSTTSSVRVRNVNFYGNVSHTGTAGLYFVDLNIGNATSTNVVTKSGSGYFELFNVDTQNISAFNVTGTGQVVFDGGLPGKIVVNNTSALVTVQGSINCKQVTVTAGIFSAVDSFLFSATTGTPAITATASAQTFIALNNSRIYNPSGTIERISIPTGCLYSLLNVVFDRANSTLTGTNLSNTLISDNLTTISGLTVGGVSTLGAVGNVRITGGTNGQVLTSNGAGGLSFTTVGGGTSISNGTSNVNIATANGNVTVGVGGVANVATFKSTGANITGTLGVSGVTTLGPVGNVVITGGTSGQYLSTNGAGALSWGTITNQGTVEYVAAYRTATQSIPGAGTDIIMTTKQLGSGNLDTTYNTTTGVFSLTAGVTYKLEFQGSVWGFSNATNGYVVIEWVNAVTNAPLAGNGEQGAATFGPVTELDPQADPTTTCILYTAPTNMTVKLRVTGTAGTADLRSNGTYASVRQIGSSSLAGNVTIGGGAAATSSTTGAIAVNGGIGIGGNAYVGSNLNVTGTSNLGAVGNVVITGGTSGQVLSTNGSGALSWATVSGSSISNGTSNVAVAASGNVTVSISGNATARATFTSTGANIAGTANITGNTAIGGNLAVTGTSNLGPVGNVVITGGTTGQVLTTNGSGVLSWGSASALGVTEYGHLRTTSTANIAVPNNIPFTSVEGTLALQSNGVVLKAGKTYRLTGAGATSNGWLQSFQWSVAPASGGATTYIGVASFTSSKASGQTNTESFQTTASAVYTATVDTIAWLTMVSDGAVTSPLDGPQCWGYAEEIGSSSLTGNVNLGGGAASTSTTTGAVIVNGGIGASGNAYIGANLNVAGTTTLGPVGNVSITGGSNAQVLTTNGSGVLSWTTPTASTVAVNGTVYGTTVGAGAGNTTPATAVDWVSINLPSAGTYRITGVMRAENGMAFALYTNANVLIANTETLVNNFGDATQCTGTGVWIYTATGATTMKVRVWSVGTPGTTISGQDGRSYVTYELVGGTTLAGNVTIGGGADSTSTTTGAVIVNGGIGISGNAYVGANLNVAGTTTLGPVGNVVVTGGTSGQTLTTNGSGVLSWSTPAAATAASFAKYYRDTQQAAVTNDPVKFTTQEALSGSDVTVNTTTGLITLAAGKTYRLRATSGLVVPAAPGQAAWILCQWFNNTAGAAIGESAIVFAPGYASGRGYYPGTGEAVITTTATTVVSYRMAQINNASAICLEPGEEGQSAWCDIEVLGGRSLAGDVSIGGGAASTSTTTGGVVVNGGLGVSGDVFASNLARKKSQIVATGVDVTLDNIKIRMAGSGRSELQISTVTGTVAFTGALSAVDANTPYAFAVSVTATTTPAYLTASGSGTFTQAGDSMIYTIMNVASNLAYRITGIPDGTGNYLITIEALI